jgi:hypothetical protein
LCGKRIGSRRRALVPECRGGVASGFGAVWGKAGLDARADRCGEALVEFGAVGPDRLPPTSLRLARRRLPEREVPSIIADSSSSSGTLWKKSRSSQTTIGRLTAT